MKRSILYAVTIGVALPIAALAAQGQNQSTPPPAPAQQQQAGEWGMYGWHMMTPEEREAYRARMLAAKTEQEREQIRNEHHELMVKRAKERGITMPEEPPAQGMGPGMMPGGPGGGMGPGRRY